MLCINLGQQNKENVAAAREFMVDPHQWCPQDAFESIKYLENLYASASDLLEVGEK